MEIPGAPLKNPKSCAHCLAWNENSCRLGFKIEKMEESVVWNKPYGLWDTWFVDIKPSEPCPKPKSNKVLMNVHRFFNMTWLDLAMRNG